MGFCEKKKKLIIMSKFAKQKVESAELPKKDRHKSLVYATMFSRKYRN